MKIELSEEQRLLRESVRRFAEEVVAPWLAAAVLFWVGSTVWGLPGFPSYVFLPDLHLR